MNNEAVSCSNRRLSATSALPSLKFAVLCLQLLAAGAFAATHEATRFPVPTGTPDPYMQAGAEFARELYPKVEVSFWKSESGTLSVSRVEDSGAKCVLRSPADANEAPRPLGSYLAGRLDLQAQVLFAMAHEVGHCKLREAFLQRSDGRAADASVFPWLARRPLPIRTGLKGIE